MNSLNMEQVLFTFLERKKSFLKNLTSTVGIDLELNEHLLIDYTTLIYQFENFVVISSSEILCYLNVLFPS